jgi:hypothetical protein
MLKYYTKDIPNIDLLKPKVMKLTYIKKIAFNMNGMTICNAKVGGQIQCEH